MKAPTFSIVIPTYNRAGFIRKTVESLLAQETDDFELMVVDDGSTDDTEQVLGDIVDPRFSYVKKGNAERAAARNFGAARSNGAYINFFDSDDLAYPNHLTEARKAIRDLGNPEIFHLGYDVRDVDGNLIRSAGHWPGSINKRLIDGNHLSCNGVFLRRDIALAFPFNETRALSASEDFELWLRLAARYPVHCRSVVTSTVINHENRSVIRVNKAGLFKRMALLEEFLFQDEAFIRTYGSQRNVFLAYRDIYIALHLAMSKENRMEVFKILLQAFRRRPAIVFTRRFLGAVKNTLK